MKCGNHLIIANICPYQITQKIKSNFYFSCSSKALKKMNEKEDWDGIFFKKNELGRSMQLSGHARCELAFVDSFETLKQNKFAGQKKLKSF